MEGGGCRGGVVVGGGGVCVCFSTSCVITKKTLVKTLLQILLGTVST